MSVGSRKILPEVEAIFTKYNDHKFGGRLKKEKAMEMLQKEYNLAEHQSLAIFHIFDKDRNDELSAWEFQKFYTLLAKDISQVLLLYDRLSAGSDGICADIEETFDALLSMKTSSGRCLQETEVEHLIKTAADSDKTIDLERFVNLVCMVKLLRD